MAELSRDEARDMRETGRRAMEQVARVAREAASQAGMSRTFARVSKVNADGTLQLELGSDLHPMPLYSVRMTTSCAAAQPGDTVVVDTYAHVPLATGVIRTAGSAAHLVPQHSQDASTVTGTLGVAHGGTGASSAAEALTALGAASATDLAAVRESVSPFVRGYWVSDLDLAKTSGIIAYTSDMKNLPVASWGVVVVAGSGGYISQLAINNYDTDSGRIWVRSTSGRDWNGWRKVA